MLVQQTENTNSIEILIFWHQFKNSELYFHWYEETWKYNKILLDNKQALDIICESNFGEAWE